MYIADTSNNRIRKVDTNGIITTVVGTGIQGSGGDNGQATNAQLNVPYNVIFDSSGNMYIADYGNHRIRKVDKTTGIITTIVGTETAGYTGDNLFGGSPTQLVIQALGDESHKASDEELERIQALLDSLKKR